MGQWPFNRALELILSKLIFVGDIIIFHAVCKTWQRITVSPPPRQLPPPLLNAADPSCPLLFEINSKEHYMKYRVMHPLYNYIWDMEFPPQAIGGFNIIRFSKYGWSLMTSVLVRPPILFNPLTQETIELPATPFFPASSKSWFFTAPPSHPDCSVVAIVAGSSCSIYVHKVGQDYWKKHYLEGKMDPYFRPLGHPILYQGLWYCLDEKRNLTAFDIQDIEYTWIVLYKIERDLDVLTALVEHEGQLLVVSMGSDCRPYIFELDLKTKSCVPMQQTSLGKNSLFISKVASFSQRAIASGTANKVFFPIVSTSTDYSFHFYSLATGKYHSFF